MVMSLRLFAFTAIAFIVFPHSAAAQSYQVNASIDFPAPTQASTIDAALDNSTVAQALFTIRGDCETTAPFTVVSIWRNGIPIGSTICQSAGKYSLDILLTPGLNTLASRSASVSKLYGPDSIPISVTLELPAQTVTLTNSSQSLPEPEQQRLDTLNQGAARELIAHTNEPSSTLSTSNTITLSVTVGGGTQPYIISLNWGDGSTETRTVDLPGTYSFEHTYEQPAAYSVRGQVTDVLGATTEFQYAVVSTTPPPTTIATSNASDSQQSRTSSDLLQFLIQGSVFVGVISLVTLSYFMGAHHLTARSPTTRPKSLKKLPRKR
jgi:hypothetical protein